MAIGNGVSFALHLIVKFVFSKKTTKIDKKIFTDDLTQTYYIMSN